MNNAEQLVSPVTRRLIRNAGIRRLPVVAAVCAALAVVYVPGAVAQETVEPVGERQLVDLEEVVVTARRREELLQDIPLAVTALSADYMRAQNITRLDDLGIHVPSLSISSGGPSTNSPIVVLRGQRPSEMLLTLDPAVPMYFAEVVLTPVQGANLALYDMANVQVLKGPQGTLFGRNSTGGALLFTPQQPGEELGGYVETRLGNYDLVHVEGAVDLPASDILKFRLAGISIDRDGYQSNVANNALRGDDQFWDEDSKGVRLTAHFMPHDRLSNLTTLSYDENNTKARIGVPQAWNSSSQLGALFGPVWNGGLGVGGPSIDEALERQRDRSVHEIETDLNTTDNVENTFAANTTELELTDQLTIKNIFGYRDVSQSYNNDADGTGLPLFGGITSTTEFVTMDPELAEMDADQYSEELQLLGDSFDGQLEWILGAYWMRMQGSDRYPNEIMGANPSWPAGGVGVPLFDAFAQNGILQVFPDGDIENEAYAVFGEGTYTINERWSLTAGARQTWDDRYLEARNITFSQTTLQTGCGMYDENDVLLPEDACSRKVDESFDKATYRGSVNFTPLQDMLLYGSVATGYRTGGFNMRGVNNASLVPFDPETVTTFEIGHKTDWQLGNLASMRTNLAIYVQEYDDIQKTIAGINPVSGNFDTYTVNAAAADINGAEFDIMIAPTENLILSLAYSYVDASYNEWERLTNNEITDFSDAPFVYIPEHSATASVNYTLSLDQKIGTVSLTASAYWQDEMDTNDGAHNFANFGWSQENLEEVLSTVEASDYTVAHFRVDWQDVMGSSFDLAAFVNNATDAEYIVGGLSVPDSLGWVGQTYGAPRTYGASLRYRF